MNKFFEFLNERYSGREYDPEKKVSKETLDLLVQAARLAPSSYNDQPWNFIICDKHNDSESYKKAFSALVSQNQAWVSRVPVLIVSIARSHHRHNNTFNRFAEYDTSAAVFSMVLQATSMGLMAHQMGGFNAEKIKELFELPTDFVPMAMIAIGYAAEGSQQPERDRRPLDENFFLGNLKNRYHLK